MSYSGHRGRGGPPRGGRGPRPEADAYRVGPLRVIVNCYKITQLPQQKYWHYDGNYFSFKCPSNLNSNRPFHLFGLISR